MLSFALDKVYESANRHYERALDNRLDDVSRCRELLESARDCVIGLEAEYDDILVAAQSATADDLPDLKQRVLGYLEVHRILPLLQSISEELYRLRLRLQHDADRLLTWPWKRADRQQALNDFDATLTDLAGYLQRLLGPEALQYRPARTGVQVNQLEELLQAIDRGQAAVAALAANLKQDPSRAGLNMYTSHIAKLVDELVAAFR